MKVIISNNQLAELIKNDNIDEVDFRSMEANRNPSDAQKVAGNYKMGHVVVHGLRISIENPIGSKRYFIDKNGNKMFTVMKNHYGYLNYTKGKDGDAIDVFLGPLREGFSRVYVVDQYINGEFDESKVMLGFATLGEAKAAYLDNYEKGWNGLKYITGVPFEIFKEWLYRGRKQTKEFREYALIKKNRTLNEQKRSLAKK